MVARALNTEFLPTISVNVVTLALHVTACAIDFAAAFKSGAAV